MRLGAEDQQVEVEDREGQQDPAQVIEDVLTWGRSNEPEIDEQPDPECAVAGERCRGEGVIVAELPHARQQLRDAAVREREGKPLPAAAPGPVGVESGQQERGQRETCEPERRGIGYPGARDGRIGYLVGSSQGIPPDGLAPPGSRLAATAGQALGWKEGARWPVCRMRMPGAKSRQVQPDDRDKATRTMLYMHLPFLHNWLSRTRWKICPERNSADTL